MIVAVLALLVGAGSPLPDRYTAGQVWNYHTRKGDEGSLLKIQSIETDPDFAKLGPVFHISVIGFRLRNPRIIPVLPHAPVSRETLDESVTELSRRQVAFPDARVGVAEWRAAKGGVFTINVAQIIEMLDVPTSRVGP